MVYISRGHGPGTIEHYEAWYGQFSEADALIMSGYLKMVSDVFIYFEGILSNPATPKATRKTAEQIIEVAGKELERRLDAMTDFYANLGDKPVNSSEEFESLSEKGMNEAIQDFCEIATSVEKGCSSILERNTTTAILGATYFYLRRAADAFMANLRKEIREDKSLC